MQKEQILYEDETILVCYKPAGIATQTARIAGRDMVSEVTNYLSGAGKGSRPPYVGVVHRLDQPVEGILVFAKNAEAAGALSRQITEHKMEKYYFAVISDTTQTPDRACSKETDAAQGGTLVDYLVKDGKTNTSRVVESAGKETGGRISGEAKRAQLYYEVKCRLEEEKIALVEIRLITGRHHQIRVQMSHAGMSLLGDHKYADEHTRQLSERLRVKQIALCACKLSFDHPLTGKKMTFRIEPQGEIFHRFHTHFS